MTLFQLEQPVQGTILLVIAAGLTLAVLGFPLLFSARGKASRVLLAGMPLLLVLLVFDYFAFTMNYREFFTIGVPKTSGEGPIQVGYQWPRGRVGVPPGEVTGLRVREMRYIRAGTWRGNYVLILEGRGGILARSLPVEDRAEVLEAARQVSKLTGAPVRKTSQRGRLGTEEDVEKYWANP